MNVNWNFQINFWLPFLDQPQSETVVFKISKFQIYDSIVPKCNHGIGTNDKITFNK